MIDAMKLLGSLMGNQASASGLGGQILGDLLGGSRSSHGGADMAGMLGKLAVGALQQFMQHQPSGSTSPLAGLTGAFGFSEQPAPEAGRDNDQALVLVQAMINAAKADGQIDDEERRKITDKLSDLGPDESEFLHDELRKPLSFDFLRDTDPDMAVQVYAASLLAIRLDTQAEANYLRQLAGQLRLDSTSVNRIHEQLGAPRIA